MSKKLVERKWLVPVVIIAVVVFILGISFSSGGGGSDSYIKTVQTMEMPGSDETWEEAWGDFLIDAEWSRQDAADGNVYVSVTGLIMYDGIPAEAQVQYLAELQVIDDKEYIVASPYTVVVDGEPVSQFEMFALINLVFGK